MIKVNRSHVIDDVSLVPGLHIMTPHPGCNSISNRSHVIDDVSLVLGLHIMTPHPGCNSISNRSHVTCVVDDMSHVPGL